MDVGLFDQGKNCQAASAPVWMITQEYGKGSKARQIKIRT